MIRLILNGKKAEQEEIRSAVTLLRSRSADIEVRVTWEKGDGERLVQEASREGVKRIVAGGGDGTLNEVVNGLAALDADTRPELAILPLGTANDFATSCAIPHTAIEALQLALSGKSREVDIVKANSRYFINVASGGFGSQVTAETPPQLKNFLGGGAYALTAVIKSLNFVPNHGRLLAENVELEGEAVVAAVCNGRQAGGGQILAPGAWINDGLLDIMVILLFPITDVAQVLQEMREPLVQGKYVKRYRSSWVDTWTDENKSVNLDGEPIRERHIRFDVLPREIQLVLPDDCPVYKTEERN